MSVAGYLAGILVSAWALVACAQNTAESPNTPPANRTSNATLAPTQLVAVRIIVKFKPPTPVQSEVLLRVLEAQSQAQVKYIASVAADTHVYLFSPAAGTTPAQILQRISAMKEVAYAELDEKTKPH
jgi:hypothetical protein